MIKRFESELLEVKELTPSVKHFKFKTYEGFDYKGGYIVSISIPSEKRIKRLYSIASNPNDNGFIELCIKYVEGGPASEYLFNLKKGDKVEMIGPFRTFFIKDKSKNIVFISTGAGIAPFRSMVYELLNENYDKKILMLNGYRYEDEILYEDELKEFSKKDNFEYHITISRPKGDVKNKGRIQGLIDKFVNDLDADFYICGLSEMITDVKELLIKNGVDEKRIYFERFDV